MSGSVAPVDSKSKMKVDFPNWLANEQNDLKGGTRIYCDQVSSVRFDGSKPILVVSKCMFCAFRPSFEVVKEGRILKSVQIC